MKLVSTLALSAVVLVCTACGFQLRGTDSEIASIARVYVDTSRDSPMREELRKVFSDRSFEVVDNRDQANVLLRVADERQSQRIVSVQKTGIVSEYELSHAVSMQVAQAQGDAPPAYDPAQDTNRVEVIREYTFDQGGVLGKEDEADILRGEMRRELALQIVLRTVATMASATQ